MFEEQGFEIYESTTKEYAEKDIYDKPGGPSKQMLDVREVLDDIKKRFYEIEERTAEWDEQTRITIASKWVDFLRKATGPIRKQAFEQALEELATTGHNVQKMEPINGWHVLDDSEDEG